MLNGISKVRLLGLCGVVAAIIGTGINTVEAARVSDIRNTKHNLSSGTSSATRDIKADTETQVCVFCHTPHAATASATPLWNRKVAGQGYTQSYIMYDSSTLDAKQVQGALNQPGGSSKLCLSCHDGTIAIGSVNVLNGQGSVNPGTQTIATTSLTAGANSTMPAGAGATTGFTRRLGVDLSNDHPISVSFNSELVNLDGELRQPDGVLVGVRSTGVKPKLPLEKTGTPGANEGQIQCASCHDPHIRETAEATVGNQKFLRLNRFQQKNPPSASGFDSTDNTGDIICLACHDRAGSAWTFSAHANPAVADETYTSGAATQREFPSGLKVWQAACLNCHDTHTVAGARRLLREGTDSVATPKAGGNPALEETCYQCHTTSAASAVTTVTGGAPDIKTDFASTIKMPLKVGTPEVHDPNSTTNISGFLDCGLAGTRCGKDLIEGRVNLGVTDLNNRHAECTDCHNPHRLIRARNGLPGALTSGNTQDAKQNGASGGAHDHRDTSGYTHTNVISGVLRGSWGVEPTYSSASFHVLPSGYTIKRGDPGTSSATDAGQTFLTREYQICLKCHSDYGYSDDNVYPAGNRPTLASNPGGTSSGTMGLTVFTNQAKEFQAPATHAGEGISQGNDGGSVNYNTRNHRSWHPVIGATGRTLSARNISSTNPWRAPWNNATGTQTMYCTDCHGSSTGSTTVIPNTDKPWGPHGSSNAFLLKGTWDNVTGSDSNLLCFKCHNSSVYSSSSDSGQRTGFYDGSSGKGNLHNYHVNRIGKELRCTWCHVAVPHGWKNRSLLVNLNDVGEEAGQGAGSSKEVATNGSSAVYNQEPYYYKAKLKISSFATSGSWAAGNCGSAGKSGTGLTTGIINGSGGSGNTTGTGKNWMTSTCNSPP